MSLDPFATHDRPVKKRYKRMTIASILIALVAGCYMIVFGTGSAWLLGVYFVIGAVGVFAAVRFQFIELDDHVYSDEQGPSGTVKKWLRKIRDLF